MARPARRRNNPKHRVVAAPPEGTHLEALSQRVSYVGSVQHKDAPSFAGKSIRPRPDSSICPRELADQQSLIQEWLEESLEAGTIGATWDGDFPRYVWRRVGETVYEARLTNSASGEYKGYPLEPDETVEGLP